MWQAWALPCPWASRAAIRPLGLNGVVFWRTPPGSGLLCRWHPPPTISRRGTGAALTCWSGTRSSARALPPVMRRGDGRGIVPFGRRAEAQARPLGAGRARALVDHLGMLVLDGLVARRVLVPERGRSLELLGRGDLFRPWQDESASFERLSWTVIEPAAIAVLDQPLTARARELPQLLEALTDRALGGRAGSPSAPRSPTPSGSRSASSSACGSSPSCGDGKPQKGPSCPSDSRTRRLPISSAPDARQSP